MKYSPKPIAFRPEWVEHFGDIETAIFFQQIHYWSDKGGRQDGFIYKTQEEIEYETTLTRFQQDRVRKKLVNQGLLEVKKVKANGVPTLHYKLSELANGFVRNSQFSFVRNSQMDLHETYNSLTESTNREYTESTNTNLKVKKNIEPEELKTKFLNNPLYAEICKQYPHRNYDLQFQLMCDWWRSNRNKLPVAISAFSKWLSNTPIDERIKTENIRKMQKEESDRNFNTTEKKATPESIKKLQEIINQLIKNKSI